MSQMNADALHAQALDHLTQGRAGPALALEREALALDPAHQPARSFLGTALEALGDLEGAAEAIDVLAAALPTNFALRARASDLHRRADQARARRLIGKDVATIAHAGFTHAAFRDAGSAPGLHVWRATFAEVEARLRPDGRAQQLAVLFFDAQASSARLDLSYGGVELDENGKRVPLDELTATAIVFFSAALGIDHTEARRLFSWLADAGPGGAHVSGCQVGWISRQKAGAAEEHGLSVREEN